MRLSTRCLLPWVTPWVGMTRLTSIRAAPSWGGGLKPETLTLTLLKQMVDSFQGILVLRWKSEFVTGMFRESTFTGLVFYIFNHCPLNYLRQKEVLEKVMFSVLVCVCECLLAELLKNYEWISMKLSEGVGDGTRNNPLEFEYHL